MHFHRYATEDLEILDSGKKKILVVGESPIINQYNHNRKLRKKFDTVLTWETNKQNDTDTFWIGCGCSFPSNYKINAWPDSRSRNDICMIAGNKRSSKPGELYSERIKAIDYFERSSSKFVLYGSGWNQRNHYGWLRPLNKLNFTKQIRYRIPQSYGGKCESKFDKLQRFRYSLCFENALTDNGYITEKIFDSMFSGCVPIYLGASNISDFVPKGCFIPKNEFDSYRSLEDYLYSVQHDEYDEYQEQIKEFSEQFIKSTFYDLRWAKEITNHCLRIMQE